MASFDASGTPIKTTTVNVTIADGASLSGSTGDLRGLTPVALIVPSGIEGTQFTFQTSYDDAVTTFANLYYDNVGTNTEFTVKFAASQNLSLAPYIDRFLGVRALKVRTGTAGSATNQAGGDNAIVGVVLAYIG
jgi:hypothetical protein